MHPLPPPFRRGVRQSVTTDIAPAVSLFAFTPRPRIRCYAIKTRKRVELSVIVELVSSSSSASTSSLHSSIVPSNLPNTENPRLLSPPLPATYHPSLAFPCFVYFTHANAGWPRQPRRPHQTRTPSNPRQTPFTNKRPRQPEQSYTPLLSPTAVTSILTISHTWQI